MKNKNIVIFSSGNSERNGVLADISAALSSRGYFCAIWRNLFANANDLTNIALLPTLIKKIPTFDYAVLICEGHDLTTISRGVESMQVRTMRDNVLFEIGLCAMALGLSRTILVTDKDDRLPDDLIGKNNTLALKQILLSNGAEEIDVHRIAQQIDDHIAQTGGALHQVVIGAASSTACGYISNFICRTLEHIHEDIQITQNKKTEVKRIPLDKVFMHIVLPENIDPAALEAIREKKEALAKGSVKTARDRPADFACYFKADELHIVDYPTNIVTSYDTAKMILEMDADDTLDINAAKRFTSKELNLYESTLKSLLNRQYISQIVQQHYAALPEEEQQSIIARVLDVVTNRLTVSRERV